MNEFDFINQYLKSQSPSPEVILGIGDDAAIVRPNHQFDWCFSSDMLLENRHFFANVEPAALAHKVLAVNLSDMAAMGATPKWALLSVALPKLDSAWLDAFCKSLFAMADEYHLQIIGGDTTKGPMTFNVTIVGQVPRGQALKRAAAKIGDDVWVSGEIGLAAAALNHHWQNVQLSEQDLLICEKKRTRPTPRVKLGERLLDFAHAAQDVSDGLWQDLEHIAEESGVGMDIDFDAIPTLASLKNHDGAAKWILTGGDDYELIFTAPVQNRECILQIAKEVGTPVSLIGSVTAQAQSGVKVYRNHEMMNLDSKGFDHFYE